jgi:hypothetical protein
MQGYPHVYSSQTIVDFHYFLLGAYVGFQHSVQYLKQTDARKADFEMCYLYTVVFW